MEYGWTSQEEAAFAQIMAVSRLQRLPAIRLYRRFKGNLARALKIAQEVYPKPSKAQLERLSRARMARKRAIVQTETAFPATQRAELRKGCGK